MIELNSPMKPNLKKLNKLLEQVNDRGWYTNFGPLHNELTARLEAYLGVNNLLLTNNGTSALQVAAKAIGSRSIIATPFSFAATVSAFKWQKDEIAFADIDKQTLNLCLKSVESAYGKGCKADTIVATHVYGNPCDVNGFDKLRENNNRQIIYDAAHSFGIKVKENSVLNYGDASTLSFHATKIFHTVEGGAIVFKDKLNFEKAKELINFGIRPANGVVDVGINAKLNEYQAAVGLVNLDEINNILEYRAELFYFYREGLKDLVEMPLWHPEANANGAYMPILLKDKKQLHYTAEKLTEKNIQSRNYFAPSLDQVYVENKNYGTINSVTASERIMCLPMHAHLKLNDIKNVIQTLRAIL